MSMNKPVNALVKYFGFIKFPLFIVIILHFIILLNFYWIKASFIYPLLLGALFVSYILLGWIVLKKGGTITNVLVSGIILGVLVGLIGGLVDGITSLVSYSSQYIPWYVELEANLFAGIIMNIIIVPIVSVGVALSIRFFGMPTVRTEQAPSDIKTKPAPQTKKRIVAKLVFYTIVLLLIYASLTGFPVPAKAEKLDCSTTYNMYFFPNILLMFAGISPSTGVSEHNAKAEVAWCLCDKLQASPSAERELAIKELCVEINQLYLERYDKSICEETASEICSDKEKNLSKWYLA